LAHLSRDIDYDVIAGIDALGFILSSALALEHAKPFIPLRKGGKLPVQVDSETFVDYSGMEKSLEIRKDAFAHFKKALIVDEWVETGSQVGAAIKLIEGQGAQIAGVLSINVDDSAGARSLRERYLILSLAEDPED
jgi:adenine phosphoribosyltransferase